VPKTCCERDEWGRCTLWVPKGQECPRRGLSTMQIRPTGPPRASQLPPLLVRMIWSWQNRVTEMNIPGFTADASLYRINNRYRFAADSSSNSDADSLHTQASPLAFEPGVRRGMDGSHMACCSCKPWLKPPCVCAERSVSPLENCRCTYDWCGDPAIVCRGAAIALPEQPG
jgi:hypothetical protein